jgi:hypothetical protein
MSSRTRWPTGCRPLPPCGRAVAFVRQPRAHRSGQGVPLEHHDATIASTSASASLLLSPSRGRKTEPPLLSLLRRARARSPPHHHQPNCIPRSPLSPATSSSSSCSELSLGKATFLTPPPREARRSSALLELVVPNPSDASVSLFSVA